MGKRAAPKSSPSKASPSKAKVAKKEELVAPAEEPTDFCKPIFELIEKSELSQGCREMLTAMSPFCLKGSPSTRHEYQTRMAEVLKKLVSGVEVERTSAVEACEKAVEEVAKQKEEAAGIVAAATEASEAARAERDSREKAMKEAEGAASSASEAVKAAKEHAANLETERAEAAAEKADYQEMMDDTWGTLKAGNFPGQKWREKAKLIAGVVEMLEKINKDLSLKGALPVALKMKPSERGKFAEKAVSFAEELFSNHIGSLGTKLDNFDTEAANRAKAVADAEASLKDATQQKEQRQDEFITAENTLLDKDTALTEAKKSEKSLGPKAADASAELELAKESLAEVQTLACKFTELLEGPKEVLPDLKAEDTASAAEGAPAEAAA
eukprot:TRINITY_DN52738_c0_g1_i1.p1 TRINITY_DN52738_c0_g1~~TRINITY_DN52738_c0_g1_i1.p1  ORF type:complete len:407 (+),score=150.67 TRINITY_DN52738_c0_g1_i1:70-1221(+)